MGLAIILLIAVAVLFLVFKVLNLSVKAMSIIIFCIAFLFTTFICFAAPAMHKPFSIDIVDYLIKINDDGTTTTTKQTTRTILQKQVPAQQAAPQTRP